MHRQRWISILALIGVLLHAGALVRHNAVMTGAALQYGTLLADLAQLCHGGTTDTTSADLPYVPRPSDAQNGCPLCSGLAPVVALAAPELAVIVRQHASAAVFYPDTRTAPERSRAVHPPARGPPALA